jgi:hypothetical protein
MANPPRSRERRKPGPAPIVSDAEIEAALLAHRGLISPAARVLGVDRKTIADRCKASAALQAARDSARDSLLDEAEDVLARKALVDEDTTSLIYLLRTVGRSRGYGDRQEVEVSGDIVLRAVIPGGTRE